MTTIHSYAIDQPPTIGMHTGPYRARSATQSMIPTKTGAAAPVGLVLPELAGRLNGMDIRVPAINVSVVDLTFITNVETNAQAVNKVIHKATTNNPDVGHIMEYVDKSLVSVDFNHSDKSSCFDSNQTCVQDKLVKVMSWYDNEWAFVIEC